MKISRIISIVLVLLFIVAVAPVAQLETWRAAACIRDAARSGGSDDVCAEAWRSELYAVPQTSFAAAAAVVLIHGFTGDRVLMSGLARRLAENGYAVLAIDVNGHGENRNPFNGGTAESDSLRSNVKTAVDYLRDNELVDGSRIVVMGHSMGAGAALDYATHDASVKGAVMISGGWALGPEHPKNALFIFAEFNSRSHPGPVHRADGSSGGRAANRTGQDLRRLRAGHRSRGDPDAGPQSHNDRRTRRLLRLQSSIGSTAHSEPREPLPSNSKMRGAALRDSRSLMFVLILVPLGSALLRLVAPG